jgi:hypothetical protein
MEFRFLRSGKFKRVASMLADCKNAEMVSMENGGPGFDDLEKKFLNSADEQFNERGWLNSDQLEALEGLWNRI